MVLFNDYTIEITPTARATEDVTVVPFRAPVRLSDAAKYRVTPRIDEHRRIDLTAQRIFGGKEYADLLLESTEKPCWEWAQDEEIIAMDSRYLLL